MKRLILASTAIAALGLAACSEVDETTTQSVPPPADQAAPASDANGQDSGAAASAQGGGTQAPTTQSPTTMRPQGEGQTAQTVDPSTDIDPIPNRPASGTGGPAPGGADGDQKPAQ